MGERLEAGDILVVAQKIVSKAEGRLVDLTNVSPSPTAKVLAKQTGKDAPTVQVVLDDSKEIIRAQRGLLVVEQKQRLDLRQCRRGSLQCGRRRRAGAPAGGW